MAKYAGFDIYPPRFSADIGITEDGDVKAELILNELYELAAEYF